MLLYHTSGLRGPRVTSSKKQALHEIPDDAQCRNAGMDSVSGGMLRGEEGRHTRPEQHTYLHHHHNHTINQIKLSPSRLSIVILGVRIEKYRSEKQKELLTMLSRFSRAASIAPRKCGGVGKPVMLRVVL